MTQLIHILDLIGTAVFAITGALAAGRKRMDVFGVVVLGCVTALGGGTLRDMVLGVSPVFWISSRHYLFVAALAAMCTYLLARRCRLPATALLPLDAIGLAVFTVIGFEKGLNISQDFSIAVVMGVITGVVGGIVRDVLSAEVPLILHQEIYASASLCGASLLALLYYLQLPASLSVLASLLTTLGIRIAALHWNLALPIFRLQEDQEKKGNGPRAGGDP
jgi:uncharacterized membrane protein YeiH